MINNFIKHINLYFQNFNLYYKETLAFYKMSLQKINDPKYGIQIPTNSAFTIETEPNFIQLHGIILAVAKRGVGKTTALSNLLRLMKNNNALDRLILVSPTYHNNKHYFQGLPLDDDNDVLEPTKDVPEKIENILNEEATEYEEYQEKLKRYKKFMSLLKRKDINIYDIPTDLLLEFSDSDFEPPIHKYNGKKPIIVVFFDDVQGSDVMKPSSKLSNLVIKHRHMGKLKDSALGTTLLFATQSYTSNSGGLLKAIRGNLTHMLVFRNKNMKEIDCISEECAGEISKEVFDDVYKKSIQNPHDFLFIDLHKKQNHLSAFRRNFNEFIVPTM